MNGCRRSRHNTYDLVVSMLHSADKYQQYDSEKQCKEFRNWLNAGQTEKKMSVQGYYCSYLTVTSRTGRQLAVEHVW